MRDFRFSTNVLNVGSRDELVDFARRAESYGYDTLFTADHIGIPAPFTPLVLIAEATERMRVGTLVLNAPFWNPSLLAREIATADVLTGGRLEVGLGAGHMKWEFDAIGLPWEPFGVRARRMAETIDELERFFTAGVDDRLPDGHSTPRPVQHVGFGGSGPPLLVGGTGDRILTVAGERADIVGIAGVYQVKGAEPGTLRLGTAEEADERVRFARDRVGDRDVEWQVLVQVVIETDDRPAVADRFIAESNGSMSRDEVLRTPFLLFGTVEEMADQVLRVRERYGFTYYTVHGQYMEAFAKVIERVRAMA